MIVNLLIEWAIAIFDVVFSWMPDVSTVVTSINAFPATVGGALGGLLGPVNSWFPGNEVLYAAAVITYLFPIFAAYRLFSWIWRHIPTIAGFGTGSG